MNNQLNRRTFIKNTSTVALGLPLVSFIPPAIEKGKLGVAAASYIIRWNRKTESKEYPRFANSLEMIEHCHAVGFGGVQVGVRGWETDLGGKVRDRREKFGLFLEGQIGLPREGEDITRFDTQIKAAKEAGATIIRTVCLSGRRYERFKSMDTFQAFKYKSIRALQRAAPIVRKHKVKLAIENHKDWRAEEMVEIIRLIDSEWIGVTIDTGNNISLLEDPMKVVETLAPYAFTAHIKDMSIEEYEDGFLLAEVPLGEGFLDLNKMVEIMQQHNSSIKFNLEMITRDPLKIPYHKESYWATMDKISGMELAKFLQIVEKHKTKSSLPRVSGKTMNQKLSAEEDNNLASLKYSMKNLPLK